MASIRACATTASAVRRTVKGGDVLDGGKLMMVGVGKEPTSPLTTTPRPVAPVTPELPRAPNAAAVPRGGATWAHIVEDTQRRPNPIPDTTRRHLRNI